MQVSPSDTIPVSPLEQIPDDTKKRMLTTDDSWFKTVSQVEEPEARQKAIDLGATLKNNSADAFTWSSGTLSKQDLREEVLACALCSPKGAFRCVAWCPKMPRVVSNGFGSCRYRSVWGASRRQCRS